MFGQLPGLGMPEPHEIADAQRVRARPGQRSLHLSGAFETGVLEAQWPRDGRQTVGTGDSGGDEPAFEDSHPTGTGSAHNGRHEVRGRTVPEMRVAVEESRREEAGSGGEFGQCAFDGTGLERAGSPAVDEFEVGDLTDRGDDGGSSFGEFGDRGLLHGPHDRLPDRSSGVGGARDLAFVEHHPHEVEIGTSRHLPGQGDG